MVVSSSEPSSLIKGENIGVIKGFFTLLKECERADYYAFADQDDYWMPGKLSAAIENINSFANGKPYLYSSATTLVDESLEPIDVKIDRSGIRASFENAMIENVATGCTEVFNHELREIIIKELPQFTPMHDWWLYLTATAFGRYYYDETSYIKYRQHEGNQVGANATRAAELNTRIKRYKSGRSKISMQLSEFIRIFEERYPANDKLLKAKQLVAAKNSLFKRLSIKKKLGIYRQRKGDDKIFAFIILMGNY